MVELNNDQIYASYDLEHWWHSSTRQVFEIAGAAGTGKTTLILYAIEKLGLKLEEVLFVSYMGKAVSQMIRHGLPAKTIHATCYTYEKEPERDENGRMVFNERGKPKMKYVQKLKDHISKKIQAIVVDEGGTIPEKNAKDLLSFGLPTIVLGDLNQLPPPFGNPYFLKEPDVVLHQIMRQEEGNPIIYLSQRILNDEPLLEGVYAGSSVIRKKNLTDYMLKHADVIITGTNRLRGEINSIFRESFLNLSHLEYPHYGEKIICRRNNWGRFIKDNKSEIYLTNGLTGFVDYVDRSTYKKGSILIDFRPDFTDKCFRNIKVSLERLNSPLVGANKDDGWIPPDMDVFEYAYALTGYSCQGSQWNNVLILEEDDFFHNPSTYKKLKYSEITRAIESVTYVLN